VIENKEPSTEKTIHRFGLDLSEADFARLGAELDRITEAEREAWRNLT
jgi:hypothetical protein